MTNNPNSSQPSSTTNPTNDPELYNTQNNAQLTNTQTKEEESNIKIEKRNFKTLQVPPKTSYQTPAKKISESGLIIIAIAIMIIGLKLDIYWFGLTGVLTVLLLCLPIVLASLKQWLLEFLNPEERKFWLAWIGSILGILVLFKYIGIYRKIGAWLHQFKYDEFGSWAEWIGAVGQISIAILAVYVAWEQYVISRDLTIQQNRITQQQTIDAYFQGVAELALNEEGLLEDWPQERAIAEGRTAAILSSVDASGKAKILRFLSGSRLVTPLMRDSHLGRPIFDGRGGYAEDRAYGVRVINLGVILAQTDLSGQDLRWTDLSEANMVRANLSHSDLVKANLSRTILYEANLMSADLKGAIFYYGLLEKACPRSRIEPPNYETGEYTGVVIEKANLTHVKNLSEEQRYYCCCWGGEITRATIPGGCQDIPNLLGR